LLLTSLALTLAAAVPFRAQSESELQAGLSEARELLDKRSWTEAEKRLLELAALHEKTPHIWLHLPQLREGLQFASFWKSYNEPRPAEVVPGELLNYSEVTGALKLRFRGPEIAKFANRTRSKEADALGRVEADRPPFGTYPRAHPAIFAGPYSIEISGSAYLGHPGTLGEPLTFVLTFDDGEMARVNCGALSRSSTARDNSIASAIEVHSGGEWRAVETRHPSPCETGKPFKFKVSVAETRVMVTYNGKPLLAADKPAQKFGQVAVASALTAEEIVLQGRAHTSFVRGALDGEFTRAWTHHVRNHPASRALPASLTARSLENDLDASLTLSELPTPVEATHAGIVDKVDAATPADVKPLFAELGALGPDVVGDDTRAWLEARLHVTASDLRSALSSTERVLQLKPDFAPALRFKGLLHARLNELRSAIDAYRVYLAREPDNDRAVFGLGDLLLVTGRLAELEVLLRERAARSRFTRELDVLNMNRWRVQNGPAWKDPYVVETEHYRVVTDIDLKTCKLAADLLESSVRRFEARLRPLPAEGARRFPVYLFSGRAGYQRYLNEGLGVREESTAGIYHLGLRQLLIWNLPDRAAMFETVRHEGLHQYLHRWIADPPVWLNEGLAEFYENAQFQRPPSQEIQLHPGHLETLQGARNTLPSLATFVRLDAEGFYSNAQLNYAQAWAFVHMLLTTTPERRKLFDALLDAGAEGAKASEAIELVFGGLDLRALDSALLEHVDALAAPKSKR
jgi:tetratricopeptide (TPR) repeat protein